MVVDAKGKMAPMACAPILDAKYKAASADEIIQDHCSHLNHDQQDNGKKLFEQRAELSNGAKHKWVQFEERHLGQWPLDALVGLAFRVIEMTSQTEALFFSGIQNTTLDWHRGGSWSVKSSGYQGQERTNRGDIQGVGVDIPIWSSVLLRHPKYHFKLAQGRILGCEVKWRSRTRRIDRNQATEG